MIILRMMLFVIWRVLWRCHTHSRVVYASHALAYAATSVYASHALAYAVVFIYCMDKGELGFEAFQSACDVSRLAMFERVFALNTGIWQSKMQAVIS